jgi:hypothetical protein
MVAAAIRGFNGFVQIVEGTPEVAEAHRLFHLKPTRENQEALLIALNQALKLDPHQVHLIKEELYFRLQGHMKKMRSKIILAEAEWLGFNTVSQKQLDYMEGIALLFMATYLPYTFKGLFGSSDLTTVEEEQELTRNVMKILFGYMKQEVPEALQSTVGTVQATVEAVMERCHEESQAKVKASIYQPNRVSRFVIRLLKGALSAGISFAVKISRAWTWLKSLSVSLPSVKKLGGMRLWAIHSMGKVWFSLRLRLFLSRLRNSLQSQDRFDGVG